MAAENHSRQGVAGNNSLPAVVGNNCSLGGQGIRPSHDGSYADGVPNHDAPNRAHAGPSDGRGQMQLTITRR